MHYNIPGHAHELTFSVYRRQNLFLDSRACDLFLDELASARKEFGFALWAYVVMPNHVHLLVWPGTGTRIEVIAKAFKGRMAKKLLRFHREQGMMKELDGYKVNEGKVETCRIWQRGGGFDRNLWNATAIRRSIEYIEANPVRKRMVAGPEEYRWSSAWARKRSEGVVPDVFAMPVAMLDAQRQSLGKV